MLKSSRFCFLVLIFLPVMVLSQSIKTSDNNVKGCAFIVRSCKSRCGTNPNDYVQWTVNGVTDNVSCKLKTAADSDTSSDGFAAVTTVIFDAPCCKKEEKSSPTTSKLSIHCLDDTKLNTLFILGVTTLACILLMCLFMCVGLLLFRTRNRSYKLDGSKEENQSLTKGSEKTSTTSTFSDCGQENNTTSSSNTPPPRYKSIKAQNTSVKSNNEPLMTNKQPTVEERKEIEMEDEYVNEETLLSKGTRSLIIKKDGFDLSGDGNGPIGNGKLANPRGRIGEDYEIRGGFIRPKRTSTRSEGKTTRFADADKTNTESSQDNTANQETSSARSSRHSNMSDQMENPYVAAPLPKSLRSSAKLDKPSPYQTLLMNNSTLDSETNEYNTLHNVTVVQNNDMKNLFALNNNSRHQKNCKANKYDVTFKTPTNIATES